VFKRLTALFQMLRLHKPYGDDREWWTWGKCKKPS